MTGASTDALPGGGLARPSLRRRVPVVIATTALAVALVTNLPLVYLMLRTAGSGWQRFATIALTPATAWLLVRTLSLVFGVLALALLIALPPAWLVTRTDLRGRKLWALAACLPLVFPSYVSAFAWTATFGPRGYLQSWLEPLGVERLPSLAYGYPGALMVLGLFTAPYLFLSLLAALRDLDPVYEESSRSLGLGPWRTFACAVVPQLRPAILGGGLLVVLYTLSDFGAVSIVRYNTFTLAIYNAYQGLFDRSVAAGLALMLVLMTLCWIGLEAVLLRGCRASRVRPAAPFGRHRLGRWAFPAQALLAVLALLQLAVPVGVVVFWTLRALRVGNPLAGSLIEIVNSLLVAAPAALAAAVLALPVALWSTRYPGRTSRVVERLCHSGYALPGIVIALSLVFFTARHARPLYQTTAVVIIAYFVRFFPQALSAVRSALEALSPRFEEVARSLGRSPLGTFGSVTLPLIRPALLSGGGLVFLTAMKELPATLLLRPTGFETLATRIWSAASEGIYSQAALPSLYLVVASAVPVYLLIIRPALAPREVER